MDGETRFPVEVLDSPDQRVTHRRRAFFLVPVIATSVAGGLLLWEVVRQNLPADVVAHWPWKLEVFDLESGATIVTVLAILLYTRAQYAETVRPVIGSALQLASPFEQGSDVDGQEPVLKLSIFNGGGGVAVVQSCTYRIARNEDAVPSPWLPYDRMQQYMTSVGLVSHEDYTIWFHGAGYPLSPLTNRDTAPITSYIRLEALLRFRIFDMKIVVRDAVGDSHQRIVSCRAALRDPAAFRLGAEQARAAGLGDGNGLREWLLRRQVRRG
ncbi:hypothetical protein [Actinoplanes sp. URMC 104]|uniref:hypothetical protein n=1 Tax=Actinoplanes sp. URMC 104 TaxID=3423409 RepID=UPI003F1B6844